MKRPCRAARGIIAQGTDCVGVFFTTPNFRVQIHGSVSEQGANGAIMNGSSSATVFEARARPNVPRSPVAQSPCGSVTGMDAGTAAVVEEAARSGRADKQPSSPDTPHT